VLPARWRLRPGTCSEEEVAYEPARGGFVACLAFCPSAAARLMALAVVVSVGIDVASDLQARDPRPGGPGVRTDV